MSSKFPPSVVVVMRFCLIIILVFSVVFILSQSVYNIVIVYLGKNESSNNCKSVMFLPNVCFLA